MQKTNRMAIARIKDRIRNATRRQAQLRGEWLDLDVKISILEYQLAKLGINGGLLI